MGVISVLKWNHLGKIGEKSEFVISPTVSNDDTSLKPAASSDSEKEIINYETI